MSDYESRLAEWLECQSTKWAGRIRCQHDHCFETATNHIEPTGTPPADSYWCNLHCPSRMTTHVVTARGFFPDGTCYPDNSRSPA